MDVIVDKGHAQYMTVALLFLALLLVLAIAGPLVGADTRSPGGWAPSEPDQHLWSRPRLRSGA